MSVEQETEVLDDPAAEYDVADPSSTVPDPPSETPEQTSPVDDGADSFVGEPPSESDPQEQPPNNVEPANSGVSDDDGESFPPELLEWSGLDEKRAKAAFGTPEQLEQALLISTMQAGRNIQLEKQRQQLEVMRQRQQTTPASQQSQQSPPPAELPQNPTQQEIKDYLLQLQVPEQYQDEEDTRALFEAIGSQISAAYAPALKKLEEQTLQQQAIVSQLWNESQAVQVARTDEEFENFIDNLPEEWHELLGKGRPDKDTPQHKARVQLFTQAQVLDDGLQSFGRSMPFQKRLELGLRSAFPEQHDTIVRKGVVSNRRRRSHLSPPTNRKGAPLTGEEAAVEKVGKFLANKGLRDEGASDDF